MKKRIVETFEIVTPESAEDGDADERGWIDDEGEHYTVEEAIAFLEGCEPSSTAFHEGVWYTNNEYHTDYATGAVESRSYHLRGYTEREQRWIYKGVSSF